MMQESLAGRGELHAPGAPVEQRGAHQRLQVADALAHRRERQVLPLGGRGQPPLVGDRDEQLEGDEIEAAHDAIPMGIRDMKGRADSGMPRKVSLYAKAWFPIA